MLEKVVTFAPSAGKITKIAIKTNNIDIVDHHVVCRHIAARKEPPENGPWVRGLVSGNDDHVTSL